MSNSCLVAKEFIFCIIFFSFLCEYRKQSLTRVTQIFPQVFIVITPFSAVTLTNHSSDLLIICRWRSYYFKELSKVEYVFLEYKKA